MNNRYNYYTNQLLINKVKQYKYINNKVLTYCI